MFVTSRARRSDYEGGVKLATDFRGMLDDIVRAGGSTHELLMQDHRVGAPLERATQAARRSVARSCIRRFSRRMAGSRTRTRWRAGSSC